MAVTKMPNTSILNIETDFRRRMFPALISNRKAVAKMADTSYGTVGRGFDSRRPLHRGGCSAEVARQSRKTAVDYSRLYIVIECSVAKGAGSSKHTDDSRSCLFSEFYNGFKKPWRSIGLLHMLSVKCGFDSRSRTPFAIV